jgi:hypothetical protein
MSADVISFPGDGLPDRQFTEADVDKCHGDAFRDLEMSLRDCVRMSGIAAELILRAKLEDNSLIVRCIPYGRNADAFGKGIRRQMAR